MESVIQCFLNVEACLKSSAIWFLSTSEKFKSSVNKSCSSGTEQTKSTWSKFREAPPALSKSRKDGKRGKLAKGALKRASSTRDYKLNSVLGSKSAEPGEPGCKLRAEPHLPGGRSQPKLTHFPTVETATFTIRVFLTLKLTRVTSTGLAKRRKGRKPRKQKTIGNFLKHLMHVEKLFHVLVQLWSLGAGASTNTFPRSGGW